MPVEELTTEPSVVVHAKSGRKLSYGEIAAFAEVPAKAPEIKPEQLKKPAEFRLIGKDVMRVELPAKVNGTAPIRHRRPGAGHALRHSAARAGRRLGPGEDRRRQGKAVAGVITIVRLAVRRRRARRDAVGGVRGAPGARSVRHLDQDRHRPGASTAKQGMAHSPPTRENPASAGDRMEPSGDARGELPKAASTVEAEYRCDYAYHAQMEPLNAVASVSPAGDAVGDLVRHAKPEHGARKRRPKLLGIPRDKVKLNDMLHGWRLRPARQSRCRIHRRRGAAVEGGRQAPVKVMWTREDDVHNGRFRPLSAHYLAPGFDASGKLVAWHHRMAADRVTPFVDPVRFQSGGGKDGILMLGADLQGYDVPHQLVEQLYRDTGVRTAPLRGIGFTANKFATETFMDEIALKRGIDPVAFRLELLKNTPRAVQGGGAGGARWRIGAGSATAAGLASPSSTIRARRSRASPKCRSTARAGRSRCTISGAPSTAASRCSRTTSSAQTESSIVYGLGMALSERISVKDGSVEQSNFYDYRVPRMNEVPEMHIEVIPTDNHPTGAGQMATPLIAPAISSAVMQLTGVRLRHTPFTPDRVKKALA